MARILYFVGLVDMLGRDAPVAVSDEIAIVGNRRP